MEIYKRCKINFISYFIWSKGSFFYEIIKIALIGLNMKIIQKKFVFSLRGPVSKKQSYRLGKRMLQEINPQISKKVNECQ